MYAVIACGRKMKKKDCKNEGDGEAFILTEEEEVLVVVWAFELLPTEATGCN